MDLILKKIFLHFLCTIGMAIIFLLPDFLFKLVENQYLILRMTLLKDFCAFLGINFILLLIPSFRLKFFFAIFFFFLSFVQLFHYSFFHSLIMPYEVMLGFSQIDEILDTLSNTIKYMMVPFIIFMVQITGTYFFLKFTNLKILKWRFALLILILCLAIGPISAYFRNSPYVYLPRIESSSIKNLYNTLSWVIGKETIYALMHQEPEKEFISYKVSKNDLEPEQLPKNIIIVMGESLTSKRMSFFGYPVMNTPQLEALKTDKNFFYSQGFSGGVTTDVSLPTFFSVKREPENIKEFLSGKTNLLKLAKAQGYKTHYISTQKLTIFGSFLGKSADVIKSLDDFQGETKEIIFDDVLLDYLKTIDLNSKNFIILHQRNSHTPYDKHTPQAFFKYDIANKDFREYMHNAYMNSLLYTDDLLVRMINYIKVYNQQSTVLFMTSDHGEMLGSDDEKGQYGHTYLEYEDAKVPFFVYAQDVDQQVNNYIKQLSAFKSHYEFSKLIASVLGYQIDNANEDGRFFINGVDISGKKGFLEYR